jgi:hypothetical protein
MLFIGAGASAPLGIPTMEKFTETVVKDFKSKNLSAYIPMVRTIQKNVESIGLNPDIEAVLAVLNARASPRRAVKDIGPAVSNFLRGKSMPERDEKAALAVKRIKKIIFDRCMRVNRFDAIHHYGRLWDSLEAIPNEENQLRIPYQRNVFTTNYDVAVEIFLRKRGVAFADGFGDRGTFEGKWGLGINLYKLHGSVNYYSNARGQIIRSEVVITEEKNIFGERMRGPMLIYPTGDKYATRSPSYDYLAQLRASLENEEACVVIGYSFRDVPILNAFTDAIRKNPRLRIILVSPSSRNVRARLPKLLQSHVFALNGSFGVDSLPAKIAERVQNWSLT